jgi:hypothetical protein
MSQVRAGAWRHCWSMTLAGVDLDSLVDRARAAGLDGQDRGAVRRLVWAELGSDAVDHAVVYAVADRLIAGSVLQDGVLSIAREVVDSARGRPVAATRANRTLRTRPGRPPLTSGARQERPTTLGSAPCWRPIAARRRAGLRPNRGRP